jgi:hypothetical protein
MSDSNDDQKPKTQVTLSGGPPRPPKKTARGLEDATPDDSRRKLSAAELAELAKFVLESLAKKQK